MRDELPHAETVRFFAAPRTQEAFRAASAAWMNHELNYDEMRAWLRYLLYEPTIMCPYCGHWEDVGDVMDQIGKLGAFWCCSTCELYGLGPWAVPA